MATTQLAKPRTIKKLEKPRPLKLSQRHSTIDERITTVEDLVSLIENVAVHLSNGFHDQSLQMNIRMMCNTLKPYALQLETIYKDQLDRAFVAIRNGSQDGRLDLTTRVHLLELIELRAKQWRHNDSMETYYTQKLSTADNQCETLMVETPTTPLSTPLIGMSSPQTAPMLGIGEVLKNSGKFAKPTRIPGKNYCKDEVVIRNSDSGKVNPGAKERLVQITGTSEDKILYAKDLIKDTIQRNASPVRYEQSGEKSGIGGSSSSLNSSASDESNRLQQQQQHSSRLRSNLLHSLSTNDASIGEYKYTVTVGNQSIKVTGSSLELVKTAKLVLEDYFSEQLNPGIEYFSFEEEAYEPGSVSSLSTPLTPMTPLTPVTPLTPLTPGNAKVLGREMSLESNATSESEETYKPLGNSVNEIPAKKEIRKLTYEFLLFCSKGPYAKRAPADWARVQKICPAIVRKVDCRMPVKVYHPDGTINNHFNCNASNDINVANRAFIERANVPKINYRYSC